MPSFAKQRKSKQLKEIDSTTTTTIMAREDPFEAQTRTLLYQSRMRRTKPQTPAQAQHLVSRGGGGGVNHRDDAATADGGVVNHSTSTSVRHRKSSSTATSTSTSQPALMVSSVPASSSHPHSHSHKSSKTINVLIRPVTLMSRSRALRYARWEQNRDKTTGRNKNIPHLDLFSSGTADTGTNTSNQQQQEQQTDSKEDIERAKKRQQIMGRIRNSVRKKKEDTLTTMLALSELNLNRRGGGGDAESSRNTSNLSSNNKQVLDNNNRQQQQRQQQQHGQQPRAAANNEASGGASQENPINLTDIPSMMTATENTASENNSDAVCAYTRQQGGDSFSSPAVGVKENNTRTRMIASHNNTTIHANTMSSSRSTNISTGDRAIRIEDAPSSPMFPEGFEFLENLENSNSKKRNKSTNSKRKGRRRHILGSPV
jgi:hypothetical protein